MVRKRPKITSCFIRLLDFGPYRSFFFLWSSISLSNLTHPWRVLKAHAVCGWCGDLGGGFGLDKPLNLPSALWFCSLKPPVYGPLLITVAGRPQGWVQHQDPAEILVGHRSLLLRLIRATIVGFGAGLHLPLLHLSEGLWTLMSLHWYYLQIHF